MMKRLVLASALFAAAPPLHAEESEAPLYAQTASRIAEAIQAGESLTRIDAMFGLSRAEYAEIDRLAGCDGEVRAGGGERVVRIDWTCGPSTNEAGLQRSTTLLFDKDGALEGFAINPLESTFAPAQETDAPEERTKLARRFGDAVTAGDDATASAHIPLISYQQRRLADFAGGDFRVSEGREGRVLVTFRTDTGLLDAAIHFDEADRPVGLIFGPSYCSYCDRTTSRRASGLRDKRKRDRRFEAGQLNRQRNQRYDAGMGARTSEICPSC